MGGIFMDESRKTYSLADISRILGRPRSTAAYWADNFQAYLPTVGSGRNKRYKHNAIELFQIIERMKEANEPNEMVEDELSIHSKEILVPDEQDEKQPLYNEIIDGYKHMVEAFKQQDEKRKQEFDELKTTYIQHSSTLLEEFKTQAINREKEHDELKTNYEQQSVIMDELKTSYKQQSTHMEELKTHNEQQSTYMEELKTNYEQQSAQMEELKNNYEQQSAHMTELQEVYKETLAAALEEQKNMLINELKQLDDEGNKEVEQRKKSWLSWFK